MRTASLVSCAVIALAGFWGAAPALAEEPKKADIDAARKALEKYQDPYVAVRDRDRSRWTT